MVSLVREECQELFTYLSTSPLAPLSTSPLAPPIFCSLPLVTFMDCATRPPRGHIFTSFTSGHDASSHCPEYASLTPGLLWLLHYYHLKAIYATRKTKLWITGSTT